MPGRIDTRQVAPPRLRITALAGGVGGAKLAQGLAQLLEPADLTIIVNTADDFDHLGLLICPDLDTVCHTLAGLANEQTGWGRAGETWNMLASLEKLGGPVWFRLGDHDLATHLERARRIRLGQPLSGITKDFCRAWGIRHTILPMSDDPVRTIVETDRGDLPFQEYFVRQRCEPRVRGFRFAGAEAARPAPGTREAVEQADAVILCPSNPWVSIDPIFAILGPPNVPVVAVSPILGGKTVKGPAAKMFTEMGLEPSAISVARHYAGLLAGFVLDEVDRDLAGSLEIPVLVTDTLMPDPASRTRLAKDVLHFIWSLRQ